VKFFSKRKHQFTSSYTSETSPVEPGVQFDFSKLVISDPTTRSTIPSEGLSSRPGIRRKLRLEPVNNQDAPKEVTVAAQVQKGLEASTQSIYKHHAVKEQQM
jgi:hypothetical protein